MSTHGGPRTITEADLMAIHTQHVNALMGVKGVVGVGVGDFSGSLCLKVFVLEGRPLREVEDDLRKIIADPLVIFHLERTDPITLF